MPLIVIQAGYPEAAPRGYSPDQWKQLMQAWKDIQTELVGLSSNSRLIVAEESGHNIMAEQPEIVIEAIRQVVKAVQH